MESKKRYWDPKELIFQNHKRFKYGIPSPNPANDVEDHTSYKNIEELDQGQKHEDAVSRVCSAAVIEIVSEQSASNDESAEITNWILKDLASTISTLKFPCKVIPFGSHVSGLACRTSDLDFFLESDKPVLTQNEAKELMNKISKPFYRSTAISKVIKIASARTPVLKMFHKGTNKDCDLTFSSIIGVRNTLLVRHFLKMNQNLRLLVLFLKIMLKRLNLHGAGKITTYMIFWLSVYYMQQEDMLPPVMKVREGVSKPYFVNGWDCRIPEDFGNSMDDPFPISHHVIQFLKFYTNFQFLNNVISPFLGCTIPVYNFQKLMLPASYTCYVTKIRQGLDSSFSCGLFNLQDPTEHNHNVTRQVTIESLNNFKLFCNYLLNYFTSKSEKNFCMQHQFVFADLPQTLPVMVPNNCIQYSMITFTELRLPEGHPIKNSFQQDGIFFLTNYIESVMQNRFKCSIEVELCNNILRIDRKSKFQTNLQISEVSICYINCQSKDSYWQSVVGDMTNNSDECTSNGMCDHCLLETTFFLESSRTGKEVRIFVESRPAFITYLNFYFVKDIQQGYPSSSTLNLSLFEH